VLCAASHVLRGQAVVHGPRYGAGRFPACQVRAVFPRHRSTAAAPVARLGSAVRVRVAVRQSCVNLAGEKLRRQGQGAESRPGGTELAWRSRAKSRAARWRLGVSDKFPTSAEVACPAAGRSSSTTRGVTKDFARNPGPPAGPPGKTVRKQGQRSQSVMSNPQCRRLFMTLGAIRWSLRSNGDRGRNAGPIWPGRSASDLPAHGLGPLHIGLAAAFRHTAIPERGASLGGRPAGPAGTGWPARISVAPAWNRHPGYDPARHRGVNLTRAGPAPRNRG